MANEKNWVKILINELGLPSTADFCRKTDLGRGLVDKLSAGDNQPRFDTLVKIKEAFPQVNMNWLVSGRGEILDEVLDDGETVMLDYYRKNIKAKKDEFLLMDFWSVMEWSAQEYQELKELDLSIKAHSIKLEGYREFSSLVILQQRQRRAISELLRNTNIAGFVDTEDKQKKLKKELSRITGEIQKTINILDGE
mgnify:CR=1 FL=1|jgi:hypothetical protein